MTPDLLDPYRRLVALAERECVLVQARHLDELGLLRAEWEAVWSDLPETPPRSAADLLHRAIALSAQTEVALTLAMDEIRGELGQTGRARAVGRAYGGGAYSTPEPVGAGAARIDTAA